MILLLAEPVLVFSTMVARMKCFNTHHHPGNNFHEPALKEYRENTLSSPFDIKTKEGKPCWTFISWSAAGIQQRLVGGLFDSLYVVG